MAIPFEGKRENFPKVFEMDYSEYCGVDNEVTNIKCSTYESVHIKKAVYGRQKLSRNLCNGKQDTKLVRKDCLEDVTISLREECQGKSSCTVPINTVSMHVFEGDCAKEQKNVLNLKFSCGKIIQAR